MTLPPCPYCELTAMLRLRFTDGKWHVVCIRCPVPGINMWLEYEQRVFMGGATREEAREAYLADLIARSLLGQQTRSSRSLYSTTVRNNFPSL